MIRIKNKWLNNISILAILFSIVFTTSFFLSRDFSDYYIIPKHYFFTFTLSLFLIAFAFIDNKTKYQSNVRLNEIDFLVLIYLVYNTAHCIVFQGNPFNNIKLINLLLTTTIYFSIRYILTNTQSFNKSKKFVYTLFATLLVLLIGQVLFGVLQIFGIFKPQELSFKITGAFGNPGLYANFLVLLVPVSISNLLFSDNKKMKLLSFIGLILCAVVLPLTEARTSWIAGGVGMFFIVGNHKFARDKYKNYVTDIWKKIVLASFVISFMLLILIALSNHKKDSANGRLFIWRVTAEMIRDSPIIGHGFDTYTAVHNNYQANYFKNNPEDYLNSELADGVTHAFNEYLQLTAEIGAVGLIIFLSILFLTIRRKIKNKGVNKQAEVYAAEGIIVVILIEAIFSYPFSDITIFALFFSALAVIVSNYSKSSKDLLLQVSIQRRKYISILLILSVLALNYFTIKRYRGEKEWCLAYNLLKNGNIGEGCKKYEEIYPVMKYNPYFIYNYASELSIMGHFSKSIDYFKIIESRLNDADYWIYLGNSYEGLGRFQKAEKCFIQATLIMPVKFYPKYRLVLLYDKQGDVNSAFKIAQEILQQDVKIPSEVVSKIKIEMLQYVKKNIAY